VEIRTVPGEHHTLFREPFIDSLASELRAGVDRALSEIDAQ
jgi:hypothetical protein